MGKIEDLRKQLQLHNRAISFGSKLSEPDQKIHNLISDLLLLKIECETFRDCYRKAFLYARHKPVSDSAFNPVIGPCKTYYNWEELTSETFRIIDIKEANGIEYYGNEIKKAQEANIRGIATTTQV